MAKRVMKKRGGFSKRKQYELGQKVKNEFVNDKSDLRRALYKDGFLRTKGLDYLDKAANASVPIAAMNPALLPYAAALQGVSKGAKGANEAALAFGFGKKKKRSVKGCGKGKKKSRKSRK